MVALVGPVVLVAPAALVAVVALVTLVALLTLGALVALVATSRITCLIDLIQGAKILLFCYHLFPRFLHITNCF